MSWLVTAGRGRRDSTAGGVTGPIDADDGEIRQGQGPPVVLEVLPHAVVLVGILCPPKKGKRFNIIMYIIYDIMGG